MWFTSDKTQSKTLPLPDFHRVFPQNFQICAALALAPLPSFLAIDPTFTALLWRKSSSPASIWPNLQSPGSNSFPPFFYFFNFFPQLFIYRGLTLVIRFNSKFLWKWKRNLLGDFAFKWKSSIKATRIRKLVKKEMWITNSTHYCYRNIVQLKELKEYRSYFV